MIGQKKLFRREPDFVIGSPSDPYLLRWWIIPRNRFFNIYLHNIKRDDEDRALHDHPWVNVSLPLTHGLTEINPCKIRALKRFRLYFRRPKSAHRLIVGSPKDSDYPPANVWTVFVTGPRVRKWGFHCPKGWVFWKEFVADNPGEVGRGCGE